MTIDHETFHAMEIDALFEELDGPGASALNAHAASCETCGSRFERLRRARQRGLAVLNEQVSDDFESRVMAAVDAALAARQSNVVPFPVRASLGPNEPMMNAPPAPSAPRVVPIFARPWFAAAATLFLVIGAAGILSQKAMSKKSADAYSMSESAPAASMPPGQAAAAPVEMAPAATATAAPTVVAALDDSPAASSANLAKSKADEGAGGALALNAPSPAMKAPRAMKPSLNAEPAPPPAAAAAPARAGSGSSSGNDITFAAAKQLYNAGRYREAKAKFDVLASANPEAALYSAQCLQHISGCSAAVPKYDGLATLYAGTSIGNRAATDLSNCNSALGRAGPAATTAPNSQHASPKSAPPPADPTPADALDNTLK